MSIEFKTHARMQCQLNNFFWQFQASQKKADGNLCISALSGYEGFGKPLAIKFGIGDTVAILTGRNKFDYAKVKEITLKGDCLLKKSRLKDDELTVTVDWFYSYPDDLPVINNKIRIELFNHKVGEHAYCLTNHAQTVSVSTINSKVENLSVIGNIIFPPQDHKKNEEQSKSLI